MVAAPSPTPVTCGCCAGWVWPAATVTLAGEIVTRLVLPLTKFTVTASGAGADRVIGNGTDCPSPTVVLDGTPITPKTTELTVAVAG